MARTRFIWLVGAAVAVLAASGVVGASAAPPVTPDATAVTQWNLIAATTLTGLPGPAGGAPPASQINMGMVQGAVYDAVNAITPKHHRPYLLQRRLGRAAPAGGGGAAAGGPPLQDNVQAGPPTIPLPPGANRPAAPPAADNPA